jgi:drug/metabolite transporter (DMT)-like permease
MWFAYAMLASALWGLEYALMGRLFDGRISPLALVSIQMAIGSVFLGGLALATGRMQADIRYIADNNSVLWLVLFSITVFTLGNFFIAASIKEANALLAGLAEISYPLFILVFTIMLGWAEPVSARALVGGILILIGAIFLKTGSA